MATEDEEEKERERRRERKEKRKEKAVVLLEEEERVEVPPYKRSPQDTQTHDVPHPKRLQPAPVHPFRVAGAVTAGALHGVTTGGVVTHGLEVMVGMPVGAQIPVGAVQVGDTPVR